MPIRTMPKRRCLLPAILLFLLALLGCGSDSKEIAGGEPQDLYKSGVLKWAEIFTPSVLSKEERRRELAWFRDASRHLRGITIQSVGKDIETCYWESQVLARAFEEITGIRVTHNVVRESVLINRLMNQLEKGTFHEDIYVADSNLLGTLLRLGKVHVLDELMAGEGRDVTNPYLDLDDFLNLSFGQDFEGRQLQIPDYQYLQVYWFRHDWFSDPDVKKRFRERFGYELGVPLNWAAYEDIARFFTGRIMENPNDSQVAAYGHADYGLPGPWLGARFSNGFFGVAGLGDKGLPNGLPVDAWGIRVENKIPVGASVQRGGAVDSPAASYALGTWLMLLQKFAPPGCMKSTWANFGEIPVRGDVAQAWWWTYIYAARNPLYNRVGSPVCDRRGRPVWRVAPVPLGRYWEPGMKRGYQGAGSWTIPKSTTGARLQASWLWAQFCLSKTVALKKFFVGVTPVRRSTLYSPEVSRESQRYGGLIEFMRSPLLSEFSDAGPNVPDYPRMSTLWWENLGDAAMGEKTPEEVLAKLAEQMDDLMASMELPVYSPRLNPKSPRNVWLNMPGAPKPRRTERAEPKTMDYDELVKVMYSQRGKEPAGGQVNE